MPEYVVSHPGGGELLGAGMSDVLAMLEDDVALGAVLVGVLVTVVVAGLLTNLVSTLHTTP